jgi:hypothetical protein
MSKVILILAVVLLCVSAVPAWADFLDDYALKSCLDQCYTTFSRFSEPSLSAQCSAACKTKYQSDRTPDYSGSWDAKDKRKDK